MAHIDRQRRQELVERMLGIRHKIKVNETGKPPETHKEMAALMVNQWDLEDEIRAIEELVRNDRDLTVQEKIKELLKGERLVKPKA